MDAENRAKQVAKAIRDQKALGVVLTGADRDSYLRAIKLLEPIGASLHDAVESFVKNRREIDLPNKTIGEVADEMLAAKRADGVSDAYQHNLQVVTNTIRRAFPYLIVELTTAQLDDWLRSLKISSRSRHNTRQTLITLFRFGRARGYLPDENTTAAEKTARGKVVEGEIEIFQPEELSKLLTHATPDLVPFLAIGGFAGLRPAEIQRLEWRDVRLEQGFIEVRAKNAKTASRRLVPIQPNLSVWLTPYSGQTGPVCRMQKTQRKSSELATKLKLKWADNGLRHSYGSYRLAILKNAAELALEMGNSPGMIFRHYRELVTERDAKAWFSISPKAPANVLPMKAALAR
ncbi:MAG: site-specific integrase [Verrucomicrobia bacterium]|nr:site-specific integrase [Verrucomicrobiota bacterium]